MFRVWLVPAVLLTACGSKDGLVAYNTPPAVSIVLPADRSSFEEGESIEFIARVDDGQDLASDLVLTWTSDVDGAIASDSRADATGSVAFATSALSPGNHTITLQAVDAEAESGSDFIGVTVTDLEDVPTISWIHPISGEYGEEGVAFEFTVLAADLQDPPEDLEVDLVSSIDGEFCSVTLDGLGVGSCSVALGVGEHTLEATATDLDGNTQSAAVYFEVVAGSLTDDDEDGWTERQGDCDDADPDVHPGAEEVDNEIDDDCDGLVDEGTPTYDDDLDGYTEVEGDCDDADARTYPGAVEACDGFDNDCDYAVDEGTVCVDDDLDGFTEIDGDCNDGSSAIYPGAPEVPDGVDQDCDGIADEGTDAYDDDGDCFCEDPAFCSGSEEPSCTSLGFSDCDDDESAVNPSALEACDRVDNDCDGVVDEADAVDATTWYADGDGDGYGDAAVYTVACDVPAGFVADADDCDDTRAAIRPGATEWCDGVDNDCDATVDESDAADAADWYADVDGDGFGDALDQLVACEAPVGYVADDADCDDLDAAVNPDATERCDGVDNDCEGSIDGSDAVDRTTWYVDGDADGYGRSSVSTLSCTAPAGYVAVGGDCDDTTNAANPGAAEICDTIDNDCDGSTDEGLTSVYYRDADGDGYGTGTTTVSACSAPLGYVATSGDCNDATAAAYPGAPESCDGLDNDCDADTDEGVTTTYYRDADGDGYGTSVTTTNACTAPTGYVAGSGDCDDTTSSAYPGRAETCDELDNDCDGNVDEGVTVTYYRDADGDGYGTTSTTSIGCSAPVGYVTNGSDCNDGDASRNPDTIWYQDGDADGYGNAAVTRASCSQPLGYVADDGDCNDGAFTINPGRSESCDSIDNDCDGSTDESGATGCDTWYYDYDGDGYGTSSSSCLCASSGYYRAETNGDCYDYNSSANPAATSWFGVSRGDGSFDYNCDSSQEQRYTNSGVCHVDLTAFDCDRTAGFIYDASTPSCGSSGDYVTSCTYMVFSCSEVTSTTTQSCR